MDPQQRLLLEAATQLLQGGVPGLAAPGEHLGGKASTPQQVNLIHHTLYASVFLPTIPRRHCSGCWQKFRHCVMWQPLLQLGVAAMERRTKADMPIAQGPGGRSGGVGVYAGMSYNEYGDMVMTATPFASAFTATGSSLSVAAGACYMQPQCSCAGPPACGKGIHPCGDKQM